MISAVRDCQSSDAGRIDLASCVVRPSSCWGSRAPGLATVRALAVARRRLCGLGDDNAAQPGRGGR